MTNLTCKICGNEVFRLVYDGPIRLGRFGDISDKSYKLYRCQECQTISLPKTFEDITEYYEGDSYRNDVNGSASVENYYRQHDKEQIRNLSLLGTGIFRNKVVTDIGCGAGSFLDSIRGYALNTVAIEPSKNFQGVLSRKQHVSFPYTADALKYLRSEVDIAVSFSVIEHIEEPISFLSEIKALLKPGGRLFLSTPNSEDSLLEAIPQEYGSFFYRKVHLWYFNAHALSYLLKKVGFNEIKISFHQRFGLGNFVRWIRDKSPQGDCKMDFISPTVDLIWKSELEQIGRADYLFAEARFTSEQSNI